jgi:hypothetical protein
MNYEAINFGSKFKLFDEQWQPKVIAEMNDYQFKIVRLEGDFIWHDHKDTDETFVVLEGVLRIDFRDGAVHIFGGRNVRCPERRRTQALCRTRGQTIADRAAKRAQYGSRGRRPDSRERYLDLTDIVQLANTMATGPGSRARTGAAACCRARPRNP